MSTSSLEARYLDSCRRHEVLPNSAVLSWFSQAKVQNPCSKKISIVVLLHQLKDTDIFPLIDILSAVKTSEIDAVDVLHESPCTIKEENVVSLMHAISVKLGIVHLQDLLLRKDLLRDLCEGGLDCHVLRLRSTHIKKLNLSGRFMRLHSLNLDFCTSLTGLHKDCFSCMPNLRCLSMCETRIADLWTAAAALNKLPSLVELRFQNCLCCKDTGPCPALTRENVNLLMGKKTGSAHINICSYDEAPSVDTGDIASQAFGADEVVNDIFPLKFSSINNKANAGADDSADGSEDNNSSSLRRLELLELSSKGCSNLIEHAKIPNEVSFGELRINDKDEFLVNRHRWDLIHTTSWFEENVSHHPSPICFEKHYREYMVSSLPRLEVLDNVPIRKMEREMASSTFSQYYEYSPYNRQHKESVVTLLRNREMGSIGINFQNSSKLKQPYFNKKSQRFFVRSLSAAKLGSSAWPLLHPVSSFSQIYKEGRKKLRPRQFEYHPSHSNLMVFGTLDGEVVVINHENGNVVGYIPSTRAMNSILGLCWLNKFPTKLVVGSDNGSLKLFDVNNMLAGVAGLDHMPGATTFDDFEQLTSVHVNSTDDQFLTSGYSKDIALYDIESGKRLQLLTDMHREPINVAKFSNHSPFMFATSSFDHDVKMWDLRQKPVRPCYAASSSRGNVMVCFSPDDVYLLVSAVDNEVKQLLAVDGRLQMNFEIASIGSAHNYTRSYYMNERDYIISGSCDEHVVRVCCAQTGRRLRDVYLEDRESLNYMFVQSLRGDPVRHFQFSVLAASSLRSSKWEIIKINMLASSQSEEDYSYGQNILPPFSLGG